MFGFTKSYPFDVAMIQVAPCKLKAVESVIQADDDSRRVLIEVEHNGHIIKLAFIEDHARSLVGMLAAIVERIDLGTDGEFGPVEPFGPERERERERDWNQ